MSISWEIEHQGMELHGAEVSWTLKNIGDETAHAGSHCGEISIWQHPDANNPDVDTTPWTNQLTVDRDVEPNTAHTMTYPIAWTGQQHGSYVARITIEPQSMAEIYFVVTQYGIERAQY